MKPPLLDTKEAATIEIRDSSGYLAAIVAIVPGHPIFIVSKSGQEDFSAFAKNLGIKEIER